MALVLMMMIYWEPFSKRSIGRFWVKRRRRSLCSQRPVARRKTHRHCKAIYSSSAARRTSASSTSQIMAILRPFKNKFTFFAKLSLWMLFSYLVGSGYSRHRVCFLNCVLNEQFCDLWGWEGWKEYSPHNSTQSWMCVGMTAARLAGFEEQESH